MFQNNNKKRAPIPRKEKTLFELWIPTTIFLFQVKVSEFILTQKESVVCFIDELFHTAVIEKVKKECDEAHKVGKLLKLDGMHTYKWAIFVILFCYSRMLDFQVNG